MVIGARRTRKHQSTLNGSNSANTGSMIRPRHKLSSQASNRSAAMNQPTTQNTTSASIDASSRPSMIDYSTNLDDDAVEISKPAQMKQRIAEYQAKLEKDLEIRDRFQLFAWGMKLRESMLRKQYFLEAVNELKRKLRRVLYMWQDKRAEDNFKELAMLIENYDKDDPYYKKKSIGKLTKHKRAVKVTKEPVLQTVDEEEDKAEDDSNASFMHNFKQRG